MKKSFIILASALFYLMIPVASFAVEDITVKVEEKVFLFNNPHVMGEEGCHYCHISDEKNKGRLVRESVDLLCSDCHRVEGEHYADAFPYDSEGLKREMARRGIVLEKKGRDCMKCHDKHYSPERTFYLNITTYAFFIEVKSLDPHWKEDNCFACHSVPPSQNPGEFKRKGDLVKVCNNCHSTISSEKLIHAVGMLPSRKIMARMPDNFALSKDGRVSCITCHELKYQCLKKEFYRKATDPLFFREGPYPKRSDICYKCHNKDDYDRLNPHDQISDEGELLEDKCLYCHEELPDPERNKGIDSVKFVTDELKDLCQRCHRDRPHPGGHWINFDHLVKPPRKIRFWLKRNAKVNNVYIPLEPGTEKIFCCTCHNPHERGVLRGKYDNGADEDRRLRLGAGFKICSVCHADKAGTEHLSR